MTNTSPDYSLANVFLKQQDASNLNGEEADVAVDNRDVVHIVSDCSIDTHKIVTMLCESLLLNFEIVVQDYLYAIKVDATNNEAIEEKCSKLLSIYSEIRKQSSTYSQRLNTNYSFYAILEHSENTQNRIESLNESIKYSKDIEFSLNYFHSISEQNWIDELTDYLYATTIHASKKELKVYIETIFEEQRKLIEGKVFKGILNNSIYALVRHPTNPRTQAERDLNDAFYTLDRKLSNLESQYDRKNTSKFEQELDQLAKEKSNISKLSLLGFSEYKEADENDEPTLEMSKAFPTFQRVTNTGIMREGIFDFYTLNNICNWGYSNTRMITRTVVNAAMTWYCAQNYKTMLEHIEKCIVDESSEKDVLNILK